MAKNRFLGSILGIFFLFSFPCLASSKPSLNCSCISLKKDWTLLFEYSRVASLTLINPGDAFSDDEPLYYDFHIVSIKPVSTEKNAEILIEGTSYHYGNGKITFSLKPNPSCSENSNLRGQFSHQVGFEDQGHAFNSGCCQCKS